MSLQLSEDMLYYKHQTKGDNMQIGSLVRIRQSFSQKCVGKLAIVVKTYPWNARIHIIDTGKTEEYALSNLEVVCLTN